MEINRTTLGLTVLLGLIKATSIEPQLPSPGKDFELAQVQQHPQDFYQNQQQCDNLQSASWYRYEFNQDACRCFFEFAPNLDFDPQCHFHTPFLNPLFPGGDLCIGLEEFVSIFEHDLGDDCFEKPSDKSNPAIDKECANLDRGKLDDDGDDCTDYEANPHWCEFEFDDFKPKELCCVCGGGSTGSCYPRGSVNWGDATFQGDQYQSLSASEKMSRLWDIISHIPKVICQQIGALDELFDTHPTKSFQDDNSDEMTGGRKKLAHQQGIVAQARFISRPGSPYTGVFEGAENVLIRMSETDVFVDGVTQGLNPSIALKFLRDGRKAANQFGMVSFEGTQSWDFFAKPFMSHVPKFEKECKPRTVGKWNAQVTPFIYQNASYPMARYTEDGFTVQDPHLPFFMEFRPREGLPVTDDNSPWYEQLEGNAIPAGTTLFDVWALDEASNDETPWESPNLFKIGEIETKTTFTQSLWGDERLFFAHRDFRKDIQEMRDKFESPETLIFDRFNQLGRWPQGQVRSAGEQEILEGMAQGCPFNWVIEQFGF